MSKAPSTILLHNVCLPSIYLISSTWFITGDNSWCTKTQATTETTSTKRETTVSLHECVVTVGVLSSNLIFYKVEIVCGIYKNKVLDWKLFVLYLLSCLVTDNVHVYYLWHIAGPVEAVQPLHFWVFLKVQKFHFAKSKL